MSCSLLTKVSDYQYSFLDLSCVYIPLFFSGGDFSIFLLVLNGHQCPWALGALVPQAPGVKDCSKDLIKTSRFIKNKYEILQAMIYKIYTRVSKTRPQGQIGPLVMNRCNLC